jgi:superoxide dismutase, Cu-Zn family
MTVRPTPSPSPCRAAHTPRRTTARTGLAAAVAVAAALAGCAATPAPSADAKLEPTRGSAVRGTVTFTERADGSVGVLTRIGGLAPNQEHGFHVHEKGDCSSPDGSSAGGHFNPAAQPHGPQDGPHHGGDMPALKADAAGNADATFTIAGRLAGAGPASLVGRAVIVHAKPDDYTTQPTGNSGDRIACGVIAMAPGAAR